MKAFLILEDGTVFQGTSIGSQKEIISEIVFNTSMTGYLDVLTTPSYAGQAVAMTYPLIGNYGVTPDMESDRPWPDGLIVRELIRYPSNFRCQGNLWDFLMQHDIPGIAGIDTRALTRRLREMGTMNGMITIDENYSLEKLLPRIAGFRAKDLVRETTCAGKLALPGRGKRVALMDFGAKRSIIQTLKSLECQVTVFPADTKAEEILAEKPQGVLLSNGPGDPKACQTAIEEVRKLYDAGIPMLAIGLGHQLLALATGADTRKMKCGHRGGNYPVRDLKSGRVYISTQSHGYEVVTDSLDPEMAEPLFVNVNDGTNEGVAYKNGKAIAVQFYPEAAKGVQSSSYLYDRFIELMGGNQ